jgi:hypothetical protein
MFGWAVHGNGTNEHIIMCGLMATGLNHAGVEQFGLMGTGGQHEADGNMFPGIGYKKFLLSIYC